MWRTFLKSTCVALFFFQINVSYDGALATYFTHSPQRCEEMREGFWRILGCNHVDKISSTVYTDSAGVFQTVRRVMQKQAYRMPCATSARSVENRPKFRRFKFRNSGIFLNSSWTTDTMSENLCMDSWNGSQYEFAPGSWLRRNRHWRWVQVAANLVLSDLSPTAKLGKWSNGTCWDKYFQIFRK